MKSFPISLIGSGKAFLSSDEFSNPLHIILCSQTICNIINNKNSFCQQRHHPQWEFERNRLKKYGGDEPIGHAHCSRKCAQLYDPFQDKVLNPFNKILEDSIISKKQNIGNQRDLIRQKDCCHKHRRSIYRKSRSRSVLYHHRQ